MLAQMLLLGAPLDAVGLLGVGLFGVAWHNVVGTAGVLLILAAYLFLQTGRVSSDSLRWSVMNGIGASLVLVSLTVDINLPAIFIESAWVVISLYGVYRWYRRRRAEPERGERPTTMEDQRH